MVVGVGFCKIKVDSNFLLLLKIKCTKFHQDRSKTVNLHTKYTNKHSVLYTGCLMKNASTHNFFIYDPISMNKKIKDMVFQALQNSHKIYFFCRYLQ
jgi:hypothetical protein